MLLHKTFINCTNCVQDMRRNISARMFSLEICHTHSRHILFLSYWFEGWGERCQSCLSDVQVTKLYIHVFTGHAWPALLHDNFARKLHFHIYRVYMYAIYMYVYMCIIANISTVPGNISCKKSQDYSQICPCSNSTLNGRTQFKKISNSITSLGCKSCFRSSRKPGLKSSNLGSKTVL
jgi:hypothetical protein